MAELTTTNSSSLSFRQPSSSDFDPPSPTFLHGTWYVTHSTLPMWKKSRNVKITYTPLASDENCIDDLVSYQSLTSDKLKTVRGIDSPDQNTPVAYNWRGKGWLKIASSHWEVLGYGEEEGGWAVTFFQKTLFTPMGVDVYAKEKGGLSQGLLEKIRGSMEGLGDKGLQQQGENLFEIRHDW